MTNTFRILHEDPTNPHRLGRHQVPDAFPENKDARHLTNPFEKIQSVMHAEHVPVFNQGNLGSCTANAALGTMACEPFFEPGLLADLNEDYAVKLYTEETTLDNTQISGQYPPQDTGSTGPWSMQALEQWGWIDDYVHTNSLHSALRLLNHGPISIGVPWFKSMFTPDRNGYIKADPASGLAGGHQVCIVGNDIRRQAVYVRNSWGESWGIDGHAWLPWEDLDWLLGNGGDVVQPVKSR